MEKSLSIIKPDGVERNLIGKILSIYEENGLRIIDLSMVGISLGIAERHYYEHRGKGFYNELIEYITSGSSVLVELEGEDAVQCVRELNDKIRALYGVSTTKNTVHGSDSIASATREIELFFGNRIKDVTSHHGADF